jgi:hypothetical protein
LDGGDFISLPVFMRLCNGIDPNQLESVDYRGRLLRHLFRKVKLHEWHYEWLAGHNHPMNRLVAVRQREIEKSTCGFTV